MAPEPVGTGPAAGQGQPCEALYHAAMLRGVVTMGWVYVVEGGSLVKIGFATDTEKRLKALQTGSPVTLQLLAKWRGTKATETAVHKRFAHLRRHGEWFARNTGLDAFIEDQTGYRPAAPRTCGTELAALVADVLDRGVTPQWEWHAERAIRNLPAGVSGRIHRKSAYPARRKR